MNADYMVLINGENPVPENYESTVELITVENAFGEQHKVEKKTLEAYLRLKKDLLENDGIEIDLVSVYRTLQFQTDSYDRHMREHGPEFTNKYVARPGHSEHHTGLAIDVSFVVNGKLVRMVPNLLKIDPLYKPLQEKLPKYGFILRYPAGKEDITKINYEPWHFRYLDDPELAKNITNRGICFEEYWEERK